MAPTAPLLMQQELRCAYYNLHAQIYNISLNLNDDDEVDALMCTEVVKPLASPSASVLYMNTDSSTLLKSWLMLMPFLYALRSDACVWIHPLSVQTFLEQWVVLRYGD